MSLTKQDLKSIEEITSKKVDELAIITAKGFSEVHKILNDHTKKLDEIIDRVSHLEFIVSNLQTRLEIVEQSLSRFSESNREDIDALYYETSILKKRLKKVELKLVSLGHK